MYWLRIVRKGFFAKARDGLIFESLIDDGYQAFKYNGVFRLCKKLFMCSWSGFRKGKGSAVRHEERPMNKAL